MVKTLDGFAKFRDWAYSVWYDENAERKKHTLDRIDVNGNYCPENCRFVDMIVQNNNRRNNVFIECMGERHTISEWGRITGIGANTISCRLYRGWSGERAIKTPVERKNT